MSAAKSVLTLGVIGVGGYVAYNWYKAKQMQQAQEAPPFGEEWWPYMSEPGFDIYQTQSEMPPPPNPGIPITADFASQAAQQARYGAATPLWMMAPAGTPLPFTSEQYYAMPEGLRGVESFELAPGAVYSARQMFLMEPSDRVVGNYLACPEPNTPEWDQPSGVRSVLSGKYDDDGNPIYLNTVIDSVGRDVTLGLDKNGVPVTTIESVGAPTSLLDLRKGIYAQYNVPGGGGIVGPGEGISILSPSGIKPVELGGIGPYSSGITPLALGSSAAAQAARGSVPAGGTFLDVEEPPSGSVSGLFGSISNALGKVRDAITGRDEAVLTPVAEQQPVQELAGQVTERTVVEVPYRSAMQQGHVPGGPGVLNKEETVAYLEGINAHPDTIEKGVYYKLTGLTPEEEAYYYPVAPEDTKLTIMSVPKTTLGLGTTSGTFWDTTLAQQAQSRILSSAMGEVSPIDQARLLSSTSMTFAVPLTPQVGAERPSMLSSIASVANSVLGLVGISTKDEQYEADLAMIEKKYGSNYADIAEEHGATLNDVDLIARQYDPMAGQFAGWAEGLYQTKFTPNVLDTALEGIKEQAPLSLGTQAGQLTTIIPSLQRVVASEVQEIYESALGAAAKTGSGVIQLSTLGGAPTLEQQMAVQQTAEKARYDTFQDLLATAQSRGIVPPSTGVAQTLSQQQAVQQAAAITKQSMFEQALAAAQSTGQISYTPGADIALSAVDKAAIEKVATTKKAADKKAADTAAARASAASGEAGKAGLGAQTIGKAYSTPKARARTASYGGWTGWAF